MIINIRQKTKSLPFFFLARIAALNGNNHLIFTIFAANTGWLPLGKTGGQMENCWKLRVRLRWEVASFCEHSSRNILALMTVKQSCWMWFSENHRFCSAKKTISTMSEAPIPMCKNPAELGNENQTGSRWICWRQGNSLNFSCHRLPEFTLITKFKI